MKLFKYIFLVILFLTSSQVLAQEVIDDPIIIIPGIGASWNWSLVPGGDEGDWDFLIGVDHYDNLILALEDKGLERDKDFFVAFYDWRKPNADSATNYLIPIIDQALLESSTGSVDIVAHSMGGLVARAYIQGSEYRDDVDDFIMMGTPNHGSSDTYMLWEGGKIPNNWNKSIQSAVYFYSLFLQYATAGTLDRYDVIHQEITSIQELLPTYDYLIDLDNGSELIPSEVMTERNLFLQVLNDDIEGELTNIVNVTNIVGTGEPTISGIEVVQVDDSKLWTDGKPQPLTPVPSDNLGDGRVTEDSAKIEAGFGFPPGPSLSNKNSLFGKLVRLFTSTVIADTQCDEFVFGMCEVVIESEHSILPTTAIQDVFFRLGLSPTTLALTPPVEPENMLTFLVASPVEITVTNSNGQRISRNINEIPSALFSGPDDPTGPKIVIIPNAGDGEYSVELVGVADGSYHLGISNLNTTGSSIHTVENTVSSGQGIGYSIQYNSDEQIISESVSEPFEIGTDDKTSLELVEELIILVDSSDLKKKYKKSLQKNLRYTKYAIKKVEKFKNSKKKIRGKKYREEAMTRVAVIQLNIFKSKIDRYTRKGKIDQNTGLEWKSMASNIISMFDVEIRNWYKK